MVYKNLSGNREVFILQKELILTFPLKNDNLKITKGGSNSHLLSDYDDTSVSSIIDSSAAGKLSDESFLMVVLILIKELARSTISFIKDMRAAIKFKTPI